MADAPKVIVLPLNRARQQLVEEAQPYVRRWARIFVRRYGYDYDELVGTGNLALTEAARRFDQSHETPFIVFAYQRVRGEMLDAAAKARRIQRRTWDREPVQVLRDLSNDPDPEINEGEARSAISGMADALATAFRLNEEGGANANAEQQLEELQVETGLRRALESLDKEQRKVVDLHYFEGVPLREVSERLELTYITTRRRHVSALATLARRLGQTGT